MRVLLDENMDHRLAIDFGDGFAVETVRSMGWQGMKNGRLLRATQDAGFDAFVTMDRALRHQQNLAASALRIVLVVAVSNRRADVWPLLARIEEALVRATAGRVSVVSAAASST